LSANSSFTSCSCLSNSYTHGTRRGLPKLPIESGPIWYQLVWCSRCMSVQKSTSCVILWLAQSTK
jgi:hypothetical protein